MSKHRLEPRRRVLPRLGRIAAAGLSLVVTMVALLGFVGLIPMDAGDGDGPDQTPVASGTGDGSAAGNATDTTGTADDAAAPDSSAARSGTGVYDVEDAATPEAAEPTQEAAAAPRKATALPADSGSGRRVVFSKSAQRVWLVSDAGKVVSTYLVSGSVTNNLGPGKYDVFSRSRWAVGIDDSGVMQYFVRFAHGPNAAIGFHSIPTKNGQPLQTVAQLGTPQSHGCIRQKMDDAIRMWEFAGVGTDVVVTA